MGKIKKPISIRWGIFWSLLGISVLVLGYSWLSYRQHLRNPSDTTIPNLGQMWEGFLASVTPVENPFLPDKNPTFWGQVNKTWLFQDSIATFGRLFKGLAIGCFTAFFVGVLMGCYQWVAKLFGVSLSFLTRVPATAMLAVFIVMVGMEEPMFVTMVAFGIFPILAQGIYLSAKHDIHTEEIDKAYSLGASNMEVIWEVVIPKILPKVLENIRLSIGPAMVFLIAAELYVAEIGFGYRIRQQARFQHMAVVYDYLIILGLIGIVLDHAMLWLINWCCPWFNRGR